MESDSPKAKRQVRRRPPATTVEGRENELISLAVDLAEKQLREGTASSQIITHYLKLGTTREELEKEGLKLENELRKAKTDSLTSGKRIEELYENAMKSFRGYNGLDEEEYLEED